MLVLPNLIPEAIPSQKCPMNMGPILNSYRDMSMHGHVHGQASAA